MMAITVLNKSNVPTGPFTREQIAQKLKSGEMALSDLAFIEGFAQWTPLEQVLARVDSSAPPPPPITLPVAVPVAGVPTYSYAATMQPPRHLVYAGFWLRVVAYILDRIIVGIPLFILDAVEDTAFIYLNPGQSLKYFDSSNEINSPFLVLIGIQMIFGVVVYWLYFAFQESSSAQATIGKRVLGLQVTDLAGNRIGFGLATGRFFGKIVSALILCVGFMMAGFTERKQALHDMMAGTLVVRK